MILVVGKAWPAVIIDYYFVGVNAARVPNRGETVCNIHLLMMDEWCEPRPGRGTARDFKPQCNCEPIIHPY